MLENIGLGIRMKGIMTYTEMKEKYGDVFLETSGLGRVPETSEIPVFHCPPSANHMRYHERLPVVRLELLSKTYLSSDCRIPVVGYYS